MKIVNKHKKIVSLSLLIVSFFFMVLYLMQRNETIRSTNPTSAEAQNNVNSLTAETGSADFCEILTISKSDLTALESFAQRKIEEETSILLPKIAWCDENAAEPAMKTGTNESRYHIDY